MVNGKLSPSLYGKSDNTDNLMSVFPANNFSLGTDPEWLQIALDTVECGGKTYSIMVQITA